MNRQDERLSTRARIVGMKQSGLTIAAIARELGVSKPTVRLWWQRWEESGNLRDKPRCGGPRKTTPAVDGQILQAVRQSPLTNAVALRNNLGLAVSAGTVRNRLHKARVHHRAPAIKEVLTERHQQARMEFAQQYVHMNLQELGRVVFSDEKTFSSTSHGRLHCWRPNNTRYQPEHIYNVARSGHVTCNVWGWIHLYGVGELTEITGRFTADQYLEILEEVLVPTVRLLLGDGPFTFMQV